MAEGECVCGGRGGGERVVACETAADTKEKSSFAKKVHPIFFFLPQRFHSSHYDPNLGQAGLFGAGLFVVMKATREPTHYSFVGLTMRTEMPHHAENNNL